MASDGTVVTLYPLALTNLPLMFVFFDRPGPIASMKVMLLLAFMSLATACGSGADERPASVLPEDDMVKLMIRLHLAETHTINSGYMLDSSFMFYNALQQEAIKTLKLDTATVNASIKWYSKHPTEALQVYTRVVDSLGLRNSTGNARF